jgi:putative endonuclease
MRTYSEKKYSGKRIGKEGERIAALFLKSKGYRQVALNWFWKRGEVDLIFRQGKDLVFVEVKTRLELGREKLFDNVDSRKIQKLKSGKDAYLARYRIGAPIPNHRIDLIGVVLSESDLEPLEIRHIISAL